MPRKKGDNNTGIAGQRKASSRDKVVMHNFNKRAPRSARKRTLDETQYDIGNNKDGSRYKGSGEGYSDQRVVPQPQPSHEPLQPQPTQEACCLVDEDDRTKLEEDIDQPHKYISKNKKDPPTYESIAAVDIQSKHPRKRRRKISPTPSANNSGATVTSGAQQQYQHLASSHHGPKRLALRCDRNNDAPNDILNKSNQGSGSGEGSNDPSDEPQALTTVDATKNNASNGGSGDGSMNKDDDLPARREGSDGSRSGVHKQTLHTYRNNALICNNEDDTKQTFDENRVAQKGASIPQHNSRPAKGNNCPSVAAMGGGGDDAHGEEKNIARGTAVAGADGALLASDDKKHARFCDKESERHTAAIATSKHRMGTRNTAQKGQTDQQIDPTSGQQALDHIAVHQGHRHTTADRMARSAPNKLTSTSICQEHRRVKNSRSVVVNTDAIEHNGDNYKKKKKHSDDGDHHDCTRHDNKNNNKHHHHHHHHHSHGDEGNANKGVPLTHGDIVLPKESRLHASQDKRKKKEKKTSNTTIHDQQIHMKNNVGVLSRQLHPGSSVFTSMLPSFHHPLATTTAQQLDAAGCGSMAVQTPLQPSIVGAIASNSLLFGDISECRTNLQSMLSYFRHIQDQYVSQMQEIFEMIDKKDVMHATDEMQAIRRAWAAANNIMGMFSTIGGTNGVSDPGNRAVNNNMGGWPGSNNIMAPFTQQQQILQPQPILPGSLLTHLEHGGNKADVHNGEFPTTSVGALMPLQQDHPSPLRRDGNYNNKDNNTLNIITDGGGGVGGPSSLPNQLPPGSINMFFNPNNNLYLGAATVNHHSPGSLLPGGMLAATPGFIPTLGGPGGVDALRVPPLSAVHALAPMIPVDPSSTFDMMVPSLMMQGGVHGGGNNGDLHI